MEEAVNAQFGEDKWIVENLKIPDLGIFCEVGAFDGVQSSNTLHFEKLGWAGVCIEPVPELAIQCRKNRTCVTVCCAAGAAQQWGSLYRHESDPGRAVVGPLVSYVEPVPIFRLDYLLPVFGAIPNLISIDTEGTELAVWEGLGTIRPEIVIIEYLQWGSNEKKQPICQQLDKDGYKVMRCTEANLIFVKK